MMYDPHRRWVTDPGRACAGEDLEKFFTGSAAVRDPVPPAAQAAWDEAKAICRTCPVMHQCRRDTWGEEYGVWGGTDPRERHLVRRAMPRAAARWPKERRAAWAAEVYYLHERLNMTFRRIRERTGIPDGLGKTLHSEHKRLLEQREAEAEAKAAEEASRAKKTVLAGLSRRDIPDVPGRRDLWVIHNGVVLDATYQAHSPSGDHVMVQINPGGSHTKVWINATDTRFYRRVPRVVRGMSGRSRYGVKRRREPLAA